MATSTQRPRIVADPHVPNATWHVGKDGSLVYKRTTGTIIGIVRVTPERLALFNDLIANPTEDEG